MLGFGMKEFQLVIADMKTCAASSVILSLRKEHEPKRRKNKVKLYSKFVLN